MTAASQDVRDAKAKYSQPTTEAEKYGPEVRAAQAEAALKRERTKMSTLHEINAGLQSLAADNRAAFELERAHGFDLSNKLTTIRNIATVALYNHEGMHVATLADALAEILKIARGDK